ncbi:CAP domain-containing protein [Aeromicrobium sp. 50.2.37]|uniref:CAP domain-containing protein n=1 Tax=Aeromicrobium sp. 50.2.37 TaxID=2969305 RepID=UPI00214FBBED|nr:CAP domain-containing protein [Aeromicrobium sp. 50.2.37]MCR4511802.1 CAP domain-containing protein [Aeromicrobium sp. 50.2.37]
MRSLLVGGLTAVLLAVTAVAAHAYIGSPTYQKQILDRTNAVRADNGRVALKLQTCLDTYANSWAKYLATQKKSLQHRPSSQLTTIMKRCNLDGIGENLARYYPTGTATVNAWVGSAGHQRNQIGSGHRYVGIGAYRDANDRYYAVALYGNPR